MLKVEFDKLNVGGYCFGDRVYIRIMLRDYVNGELVVIPANKIGMDAPISALVILYNGRNITSHLIDILIRERMAIISEDKELNFLRNSEKGNWNFNDLKETYNASRLLYQDIHKLDKNLKNCLKNCPSFNGNVNDIRVDMHFSLSGLPDKVEPSFRIFQGRRNITNSLIEKLSELGMLYREDDKYIFATDANAHIGLNYHFRSSIFYMLYYYLPTILLSGLSLLFFNKFVAILILVGGILYFGIHRTYVANLPKTKQEKIDYIEDMIFYLFKWLVAGVFCSSIAIVFLGAIGLIAPIIIVVLGIYKFRKIFL